MIAIMKDKTPRMVKNFLIVILLTGPNFSVLSQSFLSSPTRFEDSSLGKEAIAADWGIFFEKNYPFFSMEWNSDSTGCLGKRYNYVRNKSFLLSILGIKKEYFLIFFGTPNFEFKDPIFFLIEMNCII